MDILFSDSSEIPLPPAEVRIRHLNLSPLAGNSRLLVSVEIDPFLRKPNIDLVVLNSQGHEIASTSIIECQSRKMELTLHVRQKSAKGDHRLVATLYYVEILQPEDAEGVIDKQVVDSKRVDFQLE